MKNDEIAKAIRSCFISPNVMDSNLEQANIVDVMSNIANALWKIAYNLEKGEK